jgi:type II secretory pathway pseudopilin PulG
MNRRSSNSESGYILLAVLFMLVLILIAMAVAAPRIAADIQRDREDELIHCGKQYTRAIKLYYKKFGRYPSSIDQLENTNNIRFLRKRYVDPMTGKDDWKIIHFGEAHVKAMGAFGQPIQNGGLSSTAGSSVLGGTPGMTSNPLGGGSPLGGTPSLGQATPSTGSTSTPTGTGSDSSGTSGTPPGTTAPGGSSSPFGGTGASGTSPFGGSSSGTSAFGNGPTMGGAPMVGIVSKNTKASIKEYKQQKHYNEWEFVYDPTEDLLGSVGVTGGGTNLNGPGTGTTGTPTGGFPGTSTPGSPTSPVSSPTPSPSPTPQ